MNEGALKALTFVQNWTNAKAEQKQNADKKNLNTKIN